MRVFPEAEGPMVDWPRVEALPGAREALEALHGRYGLALATNAADSSEPQIRAALARVGLDAHLDRIFCFRAVGAKKSTPGFFAHILRELGVSPGQVLMVGDDWAQDVLAPGSCGIRAVWLDTRTGEDRRGLGIRTLHHLSQLPALLAAWEDGGW